jgi:hypothetical protein
MPIADASRGTLLLLLLLLLLQSHTHTPGLMLPCQHVFKDLSHRDTVGIDGVRLGANDGPWPGYHPIPVGLHCNWSAPIVTTIPDSHSRACTAPLPDGRYVPKMTTSERFAWTDCEVYPCFLAVSMGKRRMMLYGQNLHDRSADTLGSRPDCPFCFEGWDGLEPGMGCAKLCRGELQAEIWGAAGIPVSVSADVFLLFRLRVESAFAAF